MDTDGMPTNNIGNQGAVNKDEIKIIERFITPGQVVFDIGANIGLWTKEVLNKCPNVQVHVFEPAPSTYQTILEDLAELIKNGRIITNNFAISGKEEIRDFYYYETYTGWSTLHRRLELEKQSHLGAPKRFQVLSTTLDKYAKTNTIEHINFVKIDIEGGEWEALQGAEKLLYKGKIDYIQFEYGGTFLDANTTLKQVFEYLDSFRYLLFKISPNGLEHISHFLPQYENYEYSNFLAVNERFKSTLLEEAPTAINLQQLCSQYSLTSRGIIHIGAHDGKEIALYKSMGTQRILFVEANPVVFERLKANIAGHPNVQAANYAISNYNGMVNLRVTSFDQSSSILPLKRHQEIYPSIEEIHQISVQSRTLDTLLQELEINPAEFNVLVIDIQGAELLALQGSVTVLKHIEAIATEVNYEELYEGCALINQVDDFLESHDFERVETATPFHPSWGDAFYVKKPVVTMSTLGKNGRFANQIFQYAFLKIYAKEHNLRVETPQWIGQYLFGHKDPPISQQLFVFAEPSSKIAEARIPNAKKILKSVDFWGYFQYHTKYYAPHKEVFQSLFKPVPEVEAKISKALGSLRSRGKTLVGLHLRRGDYGYECFFIAPSEWYKAWLKSLWETLDQPILFIASDEPEQVLSDFLEYNPITTKDLGVDLPQTEFYPDFYLLSKCDIVAISNSSFSFAACMLNETSKLFVRPDLSLEKLIPFDPWNSDPILRDEEISSTNSDLANSALNRLISPEIKNDELYAAICKIAREADIRTVLEIGSSSGQGSTEAFVRGIRENTSQPTLFCMEISKSRFAELQNTYRNDNFVRCYNISSVSLEQFSDREQVIDFYYNNQSNLNEYPIDIVLGWLAQDVEYLKKSGISERGIQKIKQENNIDYFDVVLIDGSEFTGQAELEEVYGAKFIFLDDINTFKNFQNFQSLTVDQNYICLAQNVNLRNGYAIFQKIMFPVNFFTIVLNGEPFIRYHLDIFQQLPFKWHWHIVEGVADLKHDTAWSLKLGGLISDELHCSGRSNDGTSEYLDELTRLYPENVTVYRKPEGVFWDGKREMVNAPLENIKEECLLWQIDVDELWTVQQICKARQMFINNPEKTAAFYWCWYFVGEKLVISTRNCYAENPAQEWLRTWRFKPGCLWEAHEPPRLAEPLSNGEGRDVAAVNPFLHEETERQGLVFQHFAYTTAAQLKFKEQYYGYVNAVSQWIALQNQTKFPVLLRQYFSWVKDATRVDRAESCGVVPIAQKESNGTGWRFLKSDESQSNILATERQLPTIIIDSVFFQLYRTGIARVWNSLLEVWAKDGFSQHIIILDRAGTAPKIAGIRYLTIPAYNYDKTDADREMLQQVCDREGADLFISTYYTTPISTPSVFMAYDMIPEVLQANLNEPMWREKHHAISHASGYISISENTARDLTRFSPEIPRESVTVAHCGVDNLFKPASQEEINSFKTKYGISKPYFISVGGGSDYKNTILFFQAFGKLASKQGFEIVCTGSGILLEGEFRNYTVGSVVHKLQLSDEELRLAYAGAVALVYPSLYEGFGLPVLEAMACGCPVITCPNASIPEVAGQAALYVKDDDIDGLTDALCDVQKNNVRQSLIVAGLEQAKKFSWSQMAQTVSSALINATKLTLKETDEQTPQQLDKRKAIQELLVEMRDKPAYQLSLQYDLACIPPQLLNEYIRLLFELPYLFQDIGEVDMYYQHIQRWVDYIHTNIYQHSESKFWQSVALLFQRHAKFAVYFSNNNLKEIYVKRADIMEFALKIQGHQIDFDLPERSADRDKIRLGILADNFSTQAEIFATLPVYKHLNRDEFEIILYFINASGHRFEKCCLGYTDVAVKLPQNLNVQVETIRKWELDILFIANNITAQTNVITELALHRLAPVQVVGMNSPVTTGMRHIDYYISSKLTELENDTQNHYIENLVKLDVPAQCFDFATEEQLIKTINFKRETMGIPQNAVVYISGANFFKILPEVEETWIKIIAGVPNAVLVLYPFNPNWAPIYPVTVFKQRLLATLAKYGLGADRLILLDAVPNRADVKERLKVADIYLDSYPYAGMTSLIDPLEIGLPTVVMSGNYARSNMGASLLRELEMPDLIADNEESYIDLAIALGTNSDLRQQKSAYIKQKMQAHPAFLDSRSYSAKIGSLFKEIFYKNQVDALRENLNLREINLIIFPDWSQPEALLLEELAVVIKATATHQDKSKMTLLVDKSNISDEEANLALSSVAMNLLMEEDLDVSDGPEISLIGQLSKIQWKALMPRLHGRVVLENENKDAIARLGAEAIPFSSLDSLTNMQLL